MTQEEMKELFKQGWLEVTQTEEVTDDTDFFEVGGNSIMAVQLPSWLVQKGVKLDIMDIFTTPTFGVLATKLKETNPLYMPEEMITKEVAAREMGFASVAEGEKAEKGGFTPKDNQVCTPKEAQKDQICTPDAQKEQICTPDAQKDQICTPDAQKDQICTPDAQKDQICTPDAQKDQICTPAQQSQQICTPNQQSAQICTPAQQSQQICTPNQQSAQICTPAQQNYQICTPAQQGANMMGMPMQLAFIPIYIPMMIFNGQGMNPQQNYQICTPAQQSQQICTPKGNVGYSAAQSQNIPEKLKKFFPKPVDKPVEKPNVVKISKAKIAEKTKTPEKALMDVMVGILPTFDRNRDFFEQGITSLDTVKMVTRCGEAGYELAMKDIYMHSTFDELLGYLK